MRCRQCNYPLWNLGTPQCPECGAGFDLRGYTFTPGTVAFGCPHCGALHGGTGPQYLPATSDTASCQQCGQVMSVPHMRVAPMVENAEAFPSEALPWEQRAEIGFWVAWWRTCVMAMVEPRKLGYAIGPNVTFGSAYWFATLTAFLAALVNAVVMGTCFAAVLGIGWGQLSADERSEMIINAAMQVVGVPFSFLQTLLWAGLVGGIGHLVLKMTGNTRGEFRLTAIAMLFGYGPVMLGLIPLCGGSIGGIWAIVASILVLSTAQGVGGGRATAAVLVPFVVLVLAGCMVGLFAAIVAAAI